MVLCEGGFYRPLKPCADYQFRCPYSILTICFAIQAVSSSLFKTKLARAQDAHGVIEQRGFLSSTWFDWMNEERVDVGFAFE